MSQDGKVIVERFRVQWLNERDVDALHAVCHPDVAFHWGPLGDGRGVDGLQALEDRARAAFPDLEVSADWMLADGDYVVRRSTVTGTHRGTWFGVAPTGRRAVWTCLESYRVADGRIAEQWLNEDWASVLQQLGALPDG